MYEVKDHPAFDQIMHRIEARDYTIKYDTEWFFATVIIYFKTGFYKGVKFELSYNSMRADKETANSMSAYVYAGFWSDKRYLDSDEVPTNVKTALIQIADQLVADKKKAAAVARENDVVTKLDKAFE